MQSILTSVKKSLGIEESYEAFDPDILMHINTFLSVLTQLGVGPEEGFFVEDKNATWDSFLGDDPRFNLVKSYLFLRVRVVFDPPATSFVIESINKQIEELGWRISVFREEVSWVDPTI